MGTQFWDTKKKEEKDLNLKVLDLPVIRGEVMGRGQ